MAPSKAAETKSSELDTAQKRKRRRAVTVYDAVAGRVGYEGFLTTAQASQYRDTASTTSVAVPPEEILFRRKNTPVRYEEDDIYAAHRRLNSDHRLPDSDLLKAMHVYASDYYAATTAGKGENDYQSLDETALLAMGILLEEAAKEALGATGYLALLEKSEDAQP